MGGGVHDGGQFGLGPPLPITPMEQPQTEPALLISRLMQPPQQPPQRGGATLTPPGELSAFDLLE